MEAEQFCQEPLVNPSHTPDMVNSVAGLECCRYCENTLVCGTPKFLVDVARKIILELYEHFHAPR